MNPVQSFKELYEILKHEDGLDTLKSVLKEWEYDFEQVQEDVNEDEELKDEIPIQLYNKMKALINGDDIMCENKETDEKYDKNDDENDENDEEWSYYIYTELKNNEYIEYYDTIIDIIKKKEFEIDDIIDDLNGYSKTTNDSIIAECIIDKLTWKQNDINTIQLISCLKNALNNFINKNNINKIKIGIIIGSKNDKKIEKYDLFIQALNIFNDRELCCVLKLYIRQKMIQSVEQFNEMNIIKFIKHFFPKKSQNFTDDNFKKIFKIGSNVNFIGHNSILNKLDKKYHSRMINIKNIQIWMIAIVMQINKYFTKYESCHACFCIKFLPENDNNNNNDNNLERLILEAFKMFQKSEKELINDYCWTFIIDLSKDKPQISFELTELYDEDIISSQIYNSFYSKNQLYHLKRLDYLICKDNDNMTMALQISFHKYYKNNCVSWLTHSSGHIPFFENDITDFIPKLFKYNHLEQIIKHNQLEQIINKYKIMKIKCMDTKYSQLEQKYIDFIAHMSK